MCSTSTVFAVFVVVVHFVANSRWLRHRHLLYIVVSVVVVVVLLELCPKILASNLSGNVNSYPCP